MNLKIITNGLLWPELMRITKMDLNSLLNRLNPLKWSRSRQLVALGVAGAAACLLLASGGC